MKKEKDSVNLLIGNSASRKIFVVINYTVIALLAIVALLPIWHILCMSLSSGSAVDSGYVSLTPVDFTLYNYKFIVTNAKFYNAFFNSVIRVLLAVPFNLLCVVLVAYPLSKTGSQFHMRGFYVWYFIITMLFSGGLIPTYMIVKYTGIYNTVWALILPSCVGVFYILILMNFFKELPKELEESAVLDGASHFSVLFKIFLPLAKPAIATLVLFIFVSHWNSWFDGMIYFSRQEDQPLQTYLMTILTIPDTKNMTVKQLMELGKMSRRAISAAEIFTATIPIMLVYPFLQKYYTKGLVLGSVKG